MAANHKKKRPTVKHVARQVAAYRVERPAYEAFAAAMKRVLQMACKVAVPDAIVQARAKDPSSFAEKAVRKFHKYPNPVRQMTDLCGVRIIVQTFQQVRAVRLFIEANFEILECEDKGLLLGDVVFGYRDMHYLVRLHPDRAAKIGLEAREIKAIGRRVAEVQVRTWVQHAWADTLHDRMYKAPLSLSASARRTGALLAAIMEYGDREFDELAAEIDGMVANYAQYHGRRQVDEEIKAQQLLLDSEEDPKARKRPQIALQLARLLIARGRYRRSVEVLDPFATTGDPLRCEILLELGYALCRTFRDDPQASEYQRGQSYLKEVVKNCRCTDYPVVPNLRKLKSMHARALARLAWSWEPVSEGHVEARRLYREALEAEPANPYLLANQLGYEILHLGNDAMIDSMRSPIQAAIDTCRQHAETGTELPFAWFTAGRLSLLLGRADEAIGFYARGLRHLFEEDTCVPVEVLEDEITWLQRIHHGANELPQEHEWIQRLIALARKTYLAAEPAGGGSRQKRPKPPRVLILTGGAAHMSARTLRQVRPLAQAALEVFEGRVISGGTAVGVPGLAGEVALALKRGRRKRFELVGYRPETPPPDGPIDNRYDRVVSFARESDFSADQILRTWEDLVAEEIRPADVLMLGLGGGRLTQVEYYVALALGATVGVVRLPRPPAVPGTLTRQVVDAEAILDDPLWRGTASLLPLPYDVPTVRAFVDMTGGPFTEKELEVMAQAFHRRYVEQNTGKLPAALRPWNELSDTHLRANREQARYAARILRAAGFDAKLVRGRARKPRVSFSAKEIERMAQLEHGRWNIERLRAGWRPGKQRDDANRIHDCIVPWADLSDGPQGVRRYDREAVAALPHILASVGYAVHRVGKGGG